MIIFITALLVSSIMYAADCSCLRFLCKQESSPDELMQINNPMQSNSPMMNHLLNAEDDTFSPIDETNINEISVFNRLNKNELKTKSTQELQQLLEQIQNQAAEEQAQLNQNYYACCFQSGCAAVSMSSAGVLAGYAQIAPITLMEGWLLGLAASSPCCIGLLCYYIHAYKQLPQEKLQYERDIIKIIMKRDPNNPVTMSE